MRALLFLAALVTLGLIPAGVQAAGLGPAPAEARQFARGRPRIVVDRLELPEDTPQSRLLRKRLVPMLRREARRADWGAGRNSTITFRFEVTELRVVERADAVSVHCTAVGRLPKGKRARGSLAFSGEAAKRNQVVERTLEIVARGVIARLAELERKRRDSFASR